MRYIFAGDRDISVWVLKDLLECGYKPELLLVVEDKKESHRQDLIDIACLSSDLVIEGKNFLLPDTQSFMKSLNIDYIFGIHFPYIIPQKIIDIPKHGFLNLHPAYLPFNRGWHTPTWAILEGTPIGGSLHYINAELDMGDIIHRKEVVICTEDTANSLYLKLKNAERQAFKEMIPYLASYSLPRIPQNHIDGTSHQKNDLLKSKIQNLQLDKTLTLRELLKKLKALTTNDWKEAASFEENGTKYRLRIEIQKDRS